jgi:hypothetical protein
MMQGLVDTAGVLSGCRMAACFWQELQACKQEGHKYRTATLAHAVCLPSRSITVDQLSAD